MNLLFSEINFSYKVLCTYIVANVLFVKIVLSIPCIHHKLMKLNFIICSVLSLSSRWQQLLGKTYGLQCQNGYLMVGDLFAFRKTKSFRQHALKCWGWRWWLKRLCDWMARDESWMIKNNIQPKITWNAEKELH